MSEYQSCPVTGSKVNALPPDHPDTTDSQKPCPVTNATVHHHKDVVKNHPAISSDATAKDCPVISKAEQAGVCPVVGTAVTALPPSHPTTMNGDVCPVTNAKLSDHKQVIQEHPAIPANASAKDCPVLSAGKGQSGESKGVAVDPATANATMAQCPVTGQFADGSRPAVQLPPELAAEPIKYTLVGIPFSTFTRTIAMGLHELKIPFTPQHEAPHSEEVLKYNPFGRIPILHVEHSGRKMSMFESDSVARYLDSADDRILRFPAKDMIANQKLEEWTGIITSYVFPAVENGVVKPYLEDKSTDLSSGIQAMHKVLSIVEKRMGGPYLMGFRTTWSDLYLYPILADLAATPYGSELERYQKLHAWLIRMQNRSTAKLTRDGTLEAGASPP